MGFTVECVEKRFGTRVYGLQSIPFDRSAVISARHGLRREIDRLNYQIEKEVDPVVISELKDKVKRLRLIRNEWKRHLK